MSATDTMFLCPLDDLVPDPTQPRQFFDEEELKALATSISENGVLLPIIVREHPRSPGKLEIVAGERRWRASSLVGLKHVPVIKKELSDRAAFEIALIENTQRANLNPIEEALAFKRLHEEHHLPYVQVAEVVGRSTPYVSNTLRLLSLEDEFQRDLIEGRLSASSARVLLTLPSGPLREELAGLMRKGMGATEAEDWARSMQASTTVRGRKSRLSRTRPTQPLFDLVLSKLKSKYAHRVDLEVTGRSGSVTFQFKDLHGLYTLFKDLLK